LLRLAKDSNFNRRENGGNGCDVGSNDPNQRDGNQERVRVQATREFDAKYLIQMLYKDTTIIAGPVRVDLMRAI